MTEKIRDDTWMEGKKISKRKEVDSLLIMRNNMFLKFIIRVREHALKLGLPSAHSMRVEKKCSCSM